MKSMTLNLNTMTDNWCKLFFQALEEKQKDSESLQDATGLSIPVHSDIFFQNSKKAAGNYFRWAANISYILSPCKADDHRFLVYKRFDRVYATWAILNKKATIITIYEDGRVQIK